MGICPVCGCKTDEIDFVDHSFDGNGCQICSFCSKQLKSFENCDSPSEAQLRWLDNVLSKDTEREAFVVSALKSLRTSYPSQAFQKDTVTFRHSAGTKAEAAPLPKDQIGGEKPAASAVTSVPEDMPSYEELVQRLEKVEKSFADYKRMQMIKTVLEIGLPVIIFIIILIVFFASGFYSSLTNLFDIIKDYGF